jgi:hypothetical protein
MTASFFSLSKNERTVLARDKKLLCQKIKAERALTLAYQGSENLRLKRKRSQWLERNEHVKLVRACLLCDIPVRASKSQRPCLPCRVIRQRLTHRRSDHYKRNGVWLSLRE